LAFASVVAAFKVSNEVAKVSLDALIWSGVFKAGVLPAVVVGVDPPAAAAVYAATTSLCLLSNNLLISSNSTVTSASWVPNVTPVMG